jgi:hypothetical protein
MGISVESTHSLLAYRYVYNLLILPPFLSNSSQLQYLTTRQKGCHQSDLLHIPWTTKPLSFIQLTAWIRLFWLSCSWYCVLWQQLSVLDLWSPGGGKSIHLSLEDYRIIPRLTLIYRHDSNGPSVFSAPPDSGAFWPEV